MLFRFELTIVIPCRHFGCFKRICTTFPAITIGLIQNMSEDIQQVQRIVFGAGEPPEEKIKENILPVTVLSSIILAGVIRAFLSRHAGPLAVAQARRPRPTEELISEVGQTQKLGRSNTVAGGSNHPRRAKARHGGHSDTEERAPAKSPNTRPNGTPRPASRQSSRFCVRSSKAFMDVRDSYAKLSSTSLPDFRGSERVSESLRLPQVLA